MTKEDKELLLKDLCARLPYLENWVRYDGKDYMITGYGHDRVSLLPSMFSSGVGPCPLVEEVKPYLRPMSSMTEVEKSVLSLCDAFIEPRSIGLKLDFYNRHHFDYRDLIERGLALEAPEGMYNVKE